MWLTSNMEKSMVATRDHKAKILDPDSWTRWPILPMKRKIKGLECGVMFHSEAHEYAIAGKGKFIVYIANLFMLPKDAEGWAQLVKHEYDTIEALLADGWEVD